MMRIDLVKIGNSQGIRLPKAIIEQACLTSELALEVSGDTIIIRSAKRPRDAWQQAAEACHEACEDQLVDWDTTSADFEGQWS